MCTNSLRIPVEIDDSDVGAVVIELAAVRDYCRDRSRPKRRSGSLPPVLTKPTTAVAAPPPPRGGGGGGGARGPRAPPTAEETARTLLVELGGDQSCGTGTLGKIFAPFNVASVTGGRDGYARLAFADADAAAAALAVAHYTPTGRRLVVLAAADVAPAPAPPAAPPLPAGWEAGWSEAHGCAYYCNPALGLTQWEPPVGQGLVAYGDDDGEGEAGDAAAAAAPAEAARAPARPPSVWNSKIALASCSRRQRGGFAASIQKVSPAE